ncbi:MULTISPECIES: hypothetical protein [Pseudomonas]|uniref:Uncharacterized protein n=1 Tax=Pseudomonas quercus TaxID=2722792 RepID=A0ABX0Y9J6_9PSED|nr:MULTISPECIES: hypothetical protein [Pseudomonas]MBF7141436.1 hypothetical protein [Pseudomonas sp. LY10J]NJO99974.1 hypothetical protein [Pseudomonas quercus]
MNTPSQQEEMADIHADVRKLLVQNLKISAEMAERQLQCLSSGAGASAPYTRSQVYLMVAVGAFAGFIGGAGGVTLGMWLKH